MTTIDFLEFSLFSLWLFSLAPLSCQLKDTVTGSADEIRLVDHLFEHNGYNPLIRPVSNLNMTVTVDFGLALIQLIHVEEKSQVMKSNVWLYMVWNDYQLKWDPADFGGITVIRVNPSKIWTPDIVLYNNADGKYEVSWKPNILIHNYGGILWLPPAIYKSSCTINVEYFPFDQQMCDMKFGSWTFDAQQVVLGYYYGQHHIDLTNYWKSGSWDIVSCPGRIVNETNEGTGQPPQNHMVYSITLRRKTLFYTVNLIIPCVLISFLSICVFYLPADAGEKMTLCISILLALVVFLLLISKILPPTSVSIPLISKYLLFTFITNIFTIVITVVIINLNFRTPRTHKMPNWIKTVFLRYLPLILLMKRPDHIEEEEARKKNLKTITSSKKCNGAVNFESSRPLNLSNDSIFASTTTRDCNRDFPAEDSGSGHHPNCQKKKEYESSVNENGHSSFNNHSSRSAVKFAGITITPDLRKAVAAINFISTHLRIEEEYSRVLQDWKYVASVIDRIQLAIFVSGTVIGTFAILMNAPYIFDFVDQDKIVASIIHKNEKGIFP